MANYIINACGKTKAAVKKDLKTKIGEANKKLADLGFDELGEPKMTGFSIDAIVEGQRKSTFTDKNSLDEVESLVKGLYAANIESFGIRQLYKVTKKQADALLSRDANLPKERSPTAGILPGDEMSYRPGLDHYMKEF